MRKSDIVFHGNHAAVNVKVRGTAEDIYRAVALPREEWPGMTRADLEAAPDECWDWALQGGWALLQDAAEEIWGPQAKVYSEGRSDGWAVVAPYERHVFTADDVHSWDAIDVARWAALVRNAELIVADLPYQWASGVYLNIVEPRQERERAQANPASTAWAEPMEAQP